MVHGEHNTGDKVTISTQKGPDTADFFRKDAITFFSKIPEPPIYRRREDPQRLVAQELVNLGMSLLSRARMLGAPVEALAKAVEAHVEALNHTAQGHVEQAETAWRHALQLEQLATSMWRLWSRTDEATPPVYDRAAGVSRFDARAEPMLHTKLACFSCRKVSDFELRPTRATHHVKCEHCHRAFTAYLGKLKSLEVTSTARGRRSYVFRLDDLEGIPTRIEFDDASMNELAASRRDLLAFVYAPEVMLRAVINLNSGRVLWLPVGGPCFVATVAFGPDARELDVLRRVRDEWLLRSRGGARFVKWYYAHGPRLARAVARHPRLRAGVKRALGVIVEISEQRLP
jgi:hypothetical protein